MKDKYIRKWYSDRYHEDIDGRLMLRRRFSFLELAYGLATYKEAGGVEQMFEPFRHDSMVRERVFGELAGMLGLDYDVIYKAWLDEPEGERELLRAYRKACEEWSRA